MLPPPMARKRGEGSEPSEGKVPAVLVAAPAVVPKATDEDAGDEREAEPDEDADDDGALAELEPVTDDELDAIAAQIVGGRAAPAPAGSTALARRDPLAADMGEVRRHPLLTREEEHELAVRWVEQGDREAGRKLVTSNLRLVVKIAHEYRRAYQNLLDLVQEGNVGLVRAVQKFDPYRGVKLSTYSGWWIRAYILKYILNNWRLVKIGTTQNQRKLFFNLRKQREALLAAGVDPTPERIAKELDVTPREVVEMERRMSGPDVSLDAPLGTDDGDGRTRLDLIEDDYADPEDRVDAEEFKDLLQQKLRHFGVDLEGREREIFEERVMAEEPITLQDLGDRWGVSRERARQIEKRMLVRLREYLQGELGDAVQIALGHD
jgi:RNA polymerase sigma-32 factor